MEFPAEVVVHGIKESKGSIDGKAFSSTTFHTEVDLPDNSAGRSLGRVTRPFKYGDASEFDKWANLGTALPIRCKAVFALEAGSRSANGQETTKLTLRSLEPILAGVKPNVPTAKA